MKHHALAALALAPLFSAPAWATDYYMTARFPQGTGNTAQYVESVTIRTNEAGNKIADVTTIDSGGLVAWVNTREVNCSDHTWRLIYKIAYRVDEMTPPYRVPMNIPEEFAPIEAKSPEARTMDFICAWPKNTLKVPRTIGTTAVALSKKFARTIQPKPKGEKRLGTRPDLMFKE